MRSRIITFIFCLAISFAADAQLTINSITLPAKIKQDNTELTLDGGGLRKKFGMVKVYVIGLYTTEKNKNGADIVAADKAVAVRLTITSGMVNSNNMSESIQEGFGKSLKGNTAPMQSQINTFIETFKKENIKEGDVFELWYVPGTGVKAFKNGQLKNTTPGLDFKKALFGIWLGDSPVDEDLKKGMLGQ